MFTEQNRNIYKKTAKGRARAHSTWGTEYRARAHAYAQPQPRAAPAPAPTPDPSPPPSPSPSPSPSPVEDWFSQNLTNAGIADLARSEYNRDGEINFGDMLAIFDEVIQNGPITSSEVQDLQTLVTDASALRMPAYVQDLASKVVNPSAADMNYLEWYFSDWPPMPMLEGLVNQWFLGSVQPVTVDADGSPAQDPNETYSSVGASGYTLFGPNGPSFKDVAQGSAGDCWLLSSLAETAARDPGIIQSMFINNGNDTWTVRIYVHGAPDYVTVNDQLPVDTVNPNFNGVYAFDSPQNGILWVALAEKAFAEENLSGGISTSDPGVDSYAALNGGYPSWALTAISGTSANEYLVTSGLTGVSIALARTGG